MCVIVLKAPNNVTEVSAEMCNLCNVSTALTCVVLKGCAGH